MRTTAEKRIGQHRPSDERAAGHQHGERAESHRERDAGKPSEAEAQTRENPAPSGPTMAMMGMGGRSQLATSRRRTELARSEINAGENRRVSGVSLL